MKFTLEIKLGNEAMQTAEDVATALTDAATEMAHAYAPYVLLQVGRGNSIRDTNGNTVGKWEVI